MNAQVIISVIDSLTKLLNETDLRAVAYKLDKILIVIAEEKLAMKVIACEQYYLFDDDLNAMLKKRKEAITLKHAAIYEAQEKKMIKEKDFEHLDILKSYPAMFKFQNGCVLCYLSKNRETERLITNLIEGYLISKGHKKSY